MTFVDETGYGLGYTSSTDGGNTFSRDDVPLSAPVAVNTPVPWGINVSAPAIAARAGDGGVRVYVIWIQLERDKSVAKVAWRKTP